MIVFIVIAGIALLSTAFMLTPDLPPTPDYLILLQDSFNEFLHRVMGFIFYFLSPNLAYASLIIVAAVFASEPIYHGVMWVLRKIPVLGIK